MTLTPSQPPVRGQIELGGPITQSWSVTNSLHTEVIVTTKDRIKVVLLENLPKFRHVVSLTGPGSLFLGLLLGLVTSDFDPGREVWGISSTAWATIFWIGTITSFAWFVWSIIRYLTKSVDLEHILDELVNTHQAENDNILQANPNP